MPQHTEHKKLPYSADFLFNLVSDIEKYPDFLPWCLACRIKERKNTSIKAEMAVGYKMFREKFICTVTFDQTNYKIDVDYITGPLKHLKNTWQFNQIAPAETDIKFFIDYEFNSRILQTLLDTFFDIAFKRMVSAFEDRAKALKKQ